MKSKIIIAYFLVLSSLGMSFFIYNHYNREYIKNELHDLRASLIEEIQDLYIRNKQSEPVNQSLRKEDISKFIMSNGDLLLKSVEKYRDQAKEERRAQIIQGVKDNEAKLYHDQSSPKLGNPEGRIKIVEFMDYSCKPCSASNEILKKIIEKDNDVQVILKPVSSTEKSALISKFALAINATSQKHYRDFHNAVFQKQELDKDGLVRVSKEVGVDMEQLSKALKSKDINSKASSIIKNNLNLAKEIHLSGTPTIIIGSEVFEGDINHDKLLSAIAKLRENKSFKKNSKKDLGDSINRNKLQQKEVEEQYTPSDYDEVQDDIPELVIDRDERNIEASKDSIEISGNALVSVPQKKKNNVFYSVSD